jgi:hypothetical protein
VVVGGRGGPRAERGLGLHLISDFIVIKPSISLIGPIQPNSSAPTHFGPHLNFGPGPPLGGAPL